VIVSTLANYCSSHFLGQYIGNISFILGTLQHQLSHKTDPWSFLYQRLVSGYWDCNDKLYTKIEAGTA